MMIYEMNEYLNIMSEELAQKVVKTRRQTLQKIVRSSFCTSGNQVPIFQIQHVLHP